MSYEVLIIDFTNGKTELVEIQQNGPYVVELSSQVAYVYGEGAVPKGTFLHQLSQVDLNNKFITVSALASVVDKSSVQVFAEDYGLKFEYGVDYIITDDRIIWNGYLLEQFLELNEKLKIYW